MMYLKRKTIDLLKGIHFKGYKHTAEGSYLKLKYCTPEDVIDYKMYGYSLQDGTPAPTAPVVVESVGDLVNEGEFAGKYKVELKATGKNLFKFSSDTADWYIPYPRNVVLSENSIGVQHSSGNYVYTICQNEIPVHQGDVLCVSGTVLENVLRPIIQLLDADGNVLSTGIQNAPYVSAYKAHVATYLNTKGFEIVSANAAKVKIGFAPVSSSDYTKYSTISDIQVEKTSFTAYEPYRESVAAVYLDEPLRKIGSYTDYIDFANQKVVRRVKCYTFTGNESWGGMALYSAYNTARSSCIIPGETMLSGGAAWGIIAIGFSEKQVINDDSRAGIGTEGCFFYPKGMEGIATDRFFSCINKELCADPGNPTITDFKKIYSAGTKIYYVRKLIEEPLTMLPLSMSKGENNVFCTSSVQPSNINLTYYTDRDEVI